MDSVPVVAITCNVGVPLLGKDSFQEIDIVGVTLPITKHNFIVKDVNKLADVIRNAFRIAKEGRPGPVLIDIPKDVTAKMADYEYKTPVVPKVNKNIDSNEIAEAIDMIKKARKPFVFVGGGSIISGASAEIAEFVEKVDAPVCDTLMGKGAFDGTNERYTGMLGMHGTKTSNFGVMECDLLIVLGARFSDRVTGDTSKFASNARILQIDIDPAEINKNIKVDMSIVGDIKVVLEAINARLDKENHKEWMNHIYEMKKEYPLRYNKDILTGPYLMEKIFEVTDGNAIITTEVGQHQMWAAQYYKYKEPRTFLSSGGLGTMGYGLGASIGAKLGRKDKIVINIAGDGCFRMNMNELATATRYNIPIIEIIVNNHVLGMVRQWQTLYYGQRYSYTVLEDQVDYVKVAEGLGAKAYRVETKEDFEAALKDAIAMNIPCVLDCHIEKDDKVFPMVSPGASLMETFDC